MSCTGGEGAESAEKAASGLTAGSKYSRTWKRIAGQRGQQDLEKLEWL